MAIEADGTLSKITPSHLEAARQALDGSLLNRRLLGAERPAP